METIAKSFTECTLTYLEKEFGLRKALKHESLTNWLALTDTVDRDRADRRAAHRSVSEDALRRA